jgi:SAM-dependent methyltransferase
MQLSVKKLNRLKQLIEAQFSIPLSLRMSGAKRYRTFLDTKSFLDLALERHLIPKSISLDLGSGCQPNNLFDASISYGIDIVNHDNPLVIQCDLFRNQIPFEDGSISIVTAFDFLEHVPRVAIFEKATRLPFIELMDEIYRILETGGVFLQISPAFPMKEAFQDPTHVNILTEETFPRYFCIGSSSAPWANAYGFKGAFAILSQAWIGGKLATLMIKA